MSKQTKRLLGLLAVLALIAGFVIPTYSNIAREQQEKREEEKRMEKLYQHGFRLLEEQIATYIVEHYSGVSKVEFSPIFEDGGDGYSMLTLRVVTVVHDNHGHKAIVGGQVGDMDYGAYGLGAGISALDLYESGNHIIYLSHSAIDDEEIDVSAYETLPDKAKRSSSLGVDRIIPGLVQEKKLEGIAKSETGSPDAAIDYNLEIKRGEYREWQP